MGERELLERLSKLLDQERRFEDAGLLSLVVNVDAVGRNDRRPRFGIEYLARKAIISASSDVVAKGAEPKFYAVYASHEDPEVLYSLALEVKRTIERLKGFLISGDVDSEGLRIAATCIGFSRRYTRRSGVRPGDRIFLLGPIGHGGALAYALKNSIEPPKEALRLMENYEYFDPERHRIAAQADAAMDVSDGLAITLWDLARLSGVRIEVDYEVLREIVPKEIADRAYERSLDPAELALYGGDEYVLVYASKEDLGGIEIGKAYEGYGANVAPKGWEHW